MSATITRVDALEPHLFQIKTLAAGADEYSRKAILTAIRDISSSIETPDDTVTRLWGLPVHAAVVRTAIDLKLFNILADSPIPMNVDRLADITSAAPILLSRLLRLLAAFGDIDESGVDEFTFGAITEALAHKGNQGCLKHYFDTVGPCFQAMPAALKKRGYKDLVDANDTIWQDAYNCRENCFEWLMARPEQFAFFNEYMASRREEQATWLAVYPLNEDATGVSADRPLFVDIRGNVGHVCAELKQKYPDLPGEVVL